MHEATHDSLMRMICCWSVVNSNGSFKSQSRSRLKRQIVPTHSDVTRHRFRKPSQKENVDETPG
jgi:hypothetical protein